MDDFNLTGGHKYCWVSYLCDSGWQISLVSGLAWSLSIYINYYCFGKTNLSASRGAKVLVESRKNQNLCIPSVGRRNLALQFVSITTTNSSVAETPECRIAWYSFHTLKMHCITCSERFGRDLFQNKDDFSVEFQNIDNSFKLVRNISII